MPPDQLPRLRWQFPTEQRLRRPQRDRHLAIVPPNVAMRLVVRLPFLGINVHAETTARRDPNHATTLQPGYHGDNAPHLGSRGESVERASAVESRRGEDTRDPATRVQPRRLTASPRPPPLPQVAPNAILRGNDCSVPL